MGRNQKERELQNEEKKEYLLGYCKYKQEAKRLKMQLEELRAGEMSPGLALSDMPKAHHQRDLSDYMVKYDELADRIIKAYQNAVRKFSEVQQKIEQMKDENEKTVLTLRYLKNWKWADIASEVGVEWTHIHRIHGKALAHFTSAL